MVQATDSMQSFGFVEQDQQSFPDAMVAKESVAEQSLKSEEAPLVLQTLVQDCKQKQRSWRVAHLWLQATSRSRVLATKKKLVEQREIDYQTCKSGSIPETMSDTMAKTSSTRRTSKAPVPKPGVLPQMSSKPKLDTQNSFRNYSRRRTKDEPFVDSKASARDYSFEAPPQAATSPKSATSPLVTALDTCSRRAGTFDIVYKISKKHHIGVEVVRSELEQFRSFLGPSVKDDVMTFELFQETVRKMMNVASIADIDPKLVAIKWRQVDKDGSNYVDFEEFLLWRLSVCYTEELAVDSSERWIRNIARTHCVPLIDVERFKAVFDHYDADSSGVIDEDEFKKVLIDVMKIKDTSAISDRVLKTFYMEALAQGSKRTLDFEAFLVWYTTMFDGSLSGI